jgi:hypothetical protein
MIDPELQVERIERVYLDPMEIVQVFQPALSQLEVTCLQRWIQLQTTPQDPVAKFSYQHALESLRRIEAERDRLILVPEPVEQAPEES